MISSTVLRRTVLLAVAALVASLMLIVGAVIGAPRAHAAPLSTSPTVTQDALPTVQINGVVWAQETVGNTVYVVGNFSSARPAGSPLGTDETPRANILAYDIRTGVLSTSFVHSLNGQGKAIAASPDGSRIYIAGTFTQVDGQARSRVAAFDTATGALLSWAPAPNSAVYGISATSDTVYFAGVFSAVGGVARTRAAAVDDTGALRPWSPSIDNIVRAVVAVPGASRVYLGGHFRNVNGQTNAGFAGVDASTGASVATSASTKIIAADGSTGSGILSLKTDGNLVYGTGFNSVSAAYPQLEGTFAVQAATGDISWVNDCFGDSYDATPVGSALYVASHAHDCAAAGGFPEAGGHQFGLAWDKAASNRNNVRDSRGWDYSAYRTSGLLQWNPSFTNGKIANQSVWSFTGNTTYVSAGGEFPTVNGKAQQGLVRFAVHASAPNKYGPTVLGEPSASQAVVGGRQAVTVSAQSAYDPDDATLTYRLIRDGNTATPVASTTLPTVGFWEQASRPAVSLTDPAAPGGVTHTYRIVVTDGSASANSTTLSVAVDRPNLAAGKPATQSSTLNGFVAAKAVDGNTDGQGQQFAHTLADRQAWWQVDLQASQPLSTVSVWGRSDCCTDRLRDYWVFASATPFNTSLTPAQQAAVSGVWSSHRTTVPAQPTSIGVPSGVSGRYVMVVQNTPSEVLTLAEVKVS